MGNTDSNPGLKPTVPGHLLGLHASVSSGDPGHDNPPLAWPTHTRVLVLVPSPHVTEHSNQVFQSAQAPFAVQEIKG